MSIAELLSSSDYPQRTPSDKCGILDCRYKGSTPPLRECTADKLINDLTAEGYVPDENLRSIFYSGCIKHANSEQQDGQKID